jgi:long-chain fatty acid transport protein
MNNFFKVFVVLGLVLGLSTGLYPNGLNLNGSGSKAIAMGGAFVGLADDYSAIYWNPAGLTQIKEPQLAFFGTDIIPKPTYQYDLSIPALGVNIDIDTKAKLKHYLSGGLGFIKPVSEKVVLGVYAYVPSAVGATWKGEELAPITNNFPIEWKTLLAIVTISPTVSVQVTDKFSIGASLNINYGTLDLKRPITDYGQYLEDLDGLAVGATLGLMYKPTEKLSFGFTYKTPFTAKLTGKSQVPALAQAGLPTEDDSEREATWPMWIATGIAFKPNEKLTFTADVQYTNWKEMTVIPVTFYSDLWKSVIGERGNFELKWKDAVQLRAGMEYKVSDRLALRAGYYYDPHPSPIETHSILLPEITYNWITAGIGYHTERINLDLAVEYGMGKDEYVSDAIADPKAGMPGTHGMDILVPNIALTIKF